MAASWKGHHYRGFEEYFDVRTTTPTEGQTLVYSSSGRFVPGNVTTGGATSLSWSQITEKPLTFPATSHGHTISQIEGLQSTLDAKSNTGHSHIIADVSGLQAALDAKTDTGHGHTLADITDLNTLTVDWMQITNVPEAENRVIDVSEVNGLQEELTGLQDALDAKSNTGHVHDASEITTGVLPVERGGHGLVFPVGNTGYLKLVQTDPPQFQVVDITDSSGGGNSIVDDLVSFGLGSLGGGLAGWLFGRRPPRAPGLPDIDEDFENLYVGYNKDVFIEGYPYYVEQVPKGYHWTAQQNFEGGFFLNAARKASVGAYIPYIKWNREETTDLQFRNAGCQLYDYNETTGTSTLQTNLSPGFFETFSIDHALRGTMSGSALRFGALDNGTYIDTCVIGKDAVRLYEPGLTDYSQLSSSNLELYKDALGAPVVGTRVDRGGLHVYDAFGESSTKLVELSTTNGLVLQKDPLVSSHVSTLTNSSLSVHEATINEAWLTSLSVSQITNSALTVCHLTLEGNLSSPNSNVMGNLTVNGAGVLDSLTVSNLTSMNEAVCHELTCTTDVTCDRVLTETILTDSLIDTGVGFVLGDACNLDIGYGHTVYGELFVDKSIKPRAGRSNVDLGSPGRRFKNVWCQELRASTNSLFLGDNLKLSLDPDGLTQGGFRIQRVTPDPSGDPDLYTVDGYEDLVGDKVLAIGGFTTIDQALPTGASVCVGGDIVVNSPGKFIGDGSEITNLNVSASNVSGLENYVQLGQSNVNFGTVTATSFVGDGSGLTGIQAGTADWTQITNKPAVAIENTDVQFTSVTATTYNGLNLSLGDISDLDTSGLEANRPVFWDGSTFVTAPEVIDWTSPTLEVQVNPQPFSTAGAVDVGYPRSLWLGDNVMVVGARYEDPSAYNEGRAYIYEVNGGSWTLVQGIPGDSYSEEFGSCCACSDDGNWVAIGAPRYNSTQGDVRVFERVGGSYTLRHTFVGESTMNEFGHRVVMNAAGTVMAISAPRYNSEQGRIYMYSRSSSTWTLATTLNNPFGTNRKGCGYDMYMDEDGTKLAIGYVYSSDPGAVSVYDISSSGTLSAHKYMFPPAGLTYIHKFGIFVAVCDEFLFVCAESYSVPTSSYDSYPCYVYRLVNGTYTLIQTISSRQWANTSPLGAVSARRDTTGNVVMLLGHRADNTFGSEAGSARLFVWDSASAQFVVSKALYPPDVGATSRQYMGWSVALGTECRRLLVGLPEWIPSGYTYRQGRALVYAGTSDTVVTNTVTQNSLWVVSGSDMYFSGGLVGIGVTSPTVALDVAGTVKASSFVGNIPWTSVTGFSLPTHSHAISDVSGLSTELSGKANVGHTHSFGEITGALELSQIPGWSSGWVAGRNLLYDGTKLITSENTTGNIFVGNKFVCVEPGSGAMLEKTLGGNDNRFGISQGVGTTRVYAGGAFTGQSVRLGFSTGTDTYDDVLVVDQGSVSAPRYSVSVPDPGAMLERNYGSNNDRYGIGQDPGGILRVYGAGGFSTSSVRLGFAEPSGYNDVVVVDQTKTKVVGLLEGTGDIHAGLGVKYSELIVSGTTGNGCPVYFTGSNDWDITTNIGQSFFVTHNFGTTNYMVSCEVLYNGTSPTDGCDTWRPVVYVFNKEANTCAVRLILAGSGTAPTGKLSVGVLCTKLFVL